MMKAVVYEGENLLGEVEIYLSLSTEQDDNNGGLMRMLKLDGKIKISHYSQCSERCPPLSVLHTITSSHVNGGGVGVGGGGGGGGMCFKMVESSTQSSLYFRHQDSPIVALHCSCLRDNKTAVVPLGEQEIHLVAMHSRRDGKTPCFWGFCVASGLYESCLGLLNLRCLGIVFDLDETLVVANTMRSFEDRIEGLQRKITVETDPQRLAGMMAEMSRYQDDKAILKQYAETDQVVDNGKVHKIQAEVVPALSDNHQTLVRPLIRLQDKNIVLTRINPQIRDTSVLVRLRPAWEDLRSYLTARGRKRFEVYVCTMAERDYALEMWRLLDPDSNLISTRELLDRIVCVKPGLKKSLFNVFHDGVCHPKMALVIDDRLKVWEEKDQSRVHVVPAFAPYYAPQAEANNVIPVLCVARNVACNVRGGFFRDFDDGLLPRISEVMYEDDVKDIPFAPDVSNYLVSEDDGSVSNGNKEPLCFDGMADAEVERRLKEAILASSTTLSLPSVPSSAAASLACRLASSPPPFTIATPPITVPHPTPQASITSYNTSIFSSAPPVSRPLGSIGYQDLTLHGSSGREEGEVHESEVDPDTRRRLLILQHGQDVRDTLLNDPSFSARPPVAGPGTGPVPGPSSVHGPAPRVQSRGSWFPVEDHMSTGPLNRVAKEFTPAPDGVHVEKQRLPPPSFQRKIENSRFDRSFSEKQRQREAVRKDDRVRPNHSSPNQQLFQGDKDDVEYEQQTSLSESPPGALHDIAMRCGTKVEFRACLAATTELKFIVEAFFSGERIGEGSGVTRKEAQHRAAEAALMKLADIYLTHIKSELSAPQSDTSEAGVSFSSDVNSHSNQASIKEEMVPPSELTRSDNLSVDNSKNSMGSISVLKELCIKEGLCIDFKTSSPSTNPAQKDETYAAVEIEGQILGKGTGLSWDEAKMQAAEKALVSLKSMLGQFTQKRPLSPRLEGIPSKRLKPEYSSVL